MKLLGNSSYGYQIMDRSIHTITKYLGDEKIHKAKNEKFFKRMNVVKKNLYEVELLKSRIEQENQLLYVFSVFNTPNLECWSYATTSSTSIAMRINSRSWRWIRTLCI